jgi:hypothetical protein
MSVRPNQTLAKMGWYSGPQWKIAATRESLCGSTFIFDAFTHRRPKQHPASEPARVMDGGSVRPRRHEDSPRAARRTSAIRKATRTVPHPHHDRVP